MNGRLCTFLVVLSAGVAAGSWLDGDDGVDRPYGDLPNMPITDMSCSAVASDCAALCAGDSQCVAWAFRKPDCSAGENPLCYLKGKLMEQSYNPAVVSGVKNHQLLSPKFWPLPTASILPQGWLKQQLLTQASGLSGHLSQFWADVSNSSWLGGGADTGLHERTPYWLNGFVPLAYQLQDRSLISMVHKYVDYILAHQSPEGWLGPDDIRDGNAYWSKFPMLLALRQYYEANSSDSRVIPAMLKFLQTAHKRMLQDWPLGNTWSAARWQDLVLTVHWLLDFHPGGQEQMLWDLAQLLHQQGFDWKGWFGNDTFPTGSVKTTTLYTHGVNNGQAIKSEGVWYRQSHQDSDSQSSHVRMAKLDKYHGQASGIFGCDEHLAGTMPSRGSELCTVVETMFSYEVLFGIQGDTVFAERAETLAYNALPATLTPDMWAHQYLQQGNEMNAVHSDDHVWEHDGPDSTLYGLAPNYGCCTANFNQGWPKFTEHLVMAAGDGKGLVVAMLAPALVQYELPSGSTVSLNIATDYPFDDKVEISAQCAEGMTLSLRIPSWTVGASVQVNGSTPQQAAAGELYHVACLYSTTVLLHIPMSIRVERRYNNAASIYRGPLLYGLEMEENYKVLRSYAFQSKDYQVTPGSPWNFAIQLRDDSAPEKDMEFVTTGWTAGEHPFSPRGAPGKILALGRLLDSWGVSHNAAAAPPPSPTNSSNPLTCVTLLPFGATVLRIAELPTLDPKQEGGSVSTVCQH